MDSSIYYDINSFTGNGDNIDFTVNAASGIYKFELVFEKGIAEVNDVITVSSSGSLTLTSNSVTMSYAGGVFEIQGNDISAAATIEVAGRKGKRISATPTSAKFEIPSLVTADTLAEFPELAKV